MGTQMNTRRIMAKAVRAHEPFKRGNISAERFENASYASIGRLPSFLADQLKARKAVYVVYSWQTPIGWCNLDGKDEWFIPEIWYSGSTMHHQNLLHVITKFPYMYG